MSRSLLESDSLDSTSTADAFFASSGMQRRDYIEDEEKLPTKWQGSATVEVYISSTPRISIGNVVGSALYGTIWQSLSVLCPFQKGKKKMRECSENSMPFSIKYLTDGGGIGDSIANIQIWSSKFENKQKRNLLFGAIAGAFQAMSETQRNCFDANFAETNYRFCNVGHKVGVYLPDGHLFVSLKTISGDNDGSFRCCESREAVDAKLDELKTELTGLYPKPYSKFRKVECHLGCSDNQQEDLVDVDKILAEMIKFDSDQDYEDQLSPKNDQYADS
ncbi:hypothetical protein N0V94_008487 [Neodidymelliopsis sp. IMI 364377]|nr:hypothetical protein N0V94_008487 [Neodidymelliopsis sp. IMI 364377]